MGVGVDTGQLPQIVNSGGRQMERPERDQRLRAVCREFEGVFLAMLIREMKATVQRGKLLPSGAANEMFESMWGQEIGRVAAGRSPLGIAEMVMGSLEGGRPDPDSRPQVASGDSR